MSRKADLAALTELSCRRARQGRVESTSFRHSLSPLSFALTALLSHFSLCTLPPPPRHLGQLVVVWCAGATPGFHFPLSCRPQQSPHARPLSQPAPDCRAARAVHTLLRAQNTALPCTLASQQHYALWSAVEWQGAAQVVGESCIPAHWLPTHKQWVPVPTS